VRLSTDRILTTHVGSLPRSQKVSELLLKKEQDEAYDPAEFDTVMREAVAQVVDDQKRIGIDVVSDGETSKIGYATYIKDRCEGFGGGDYTPPIHLDLKDHPEYRQMMVRMRGPQLFRRLCCVGPISVKDRSQLDAELGNFRAAMDAAGVAEGFLNSASPGVIASFQPNRYYPTHEAYIEALAEVMREEYEAIVNAGFLLQIDCPDLAMSRHTGFQDLTDDEFMKRIVFHVEVLNHTLRNIPADKLRMHICWGNYEGPHDFDVPLEKIHAVIVKAKPQGISFEAANPRHDHEWNVWRELNTPDDKVLLPGVIDSSTNYVEHPELVAQRIERFAGAVGRERVIASVDCGFGTFAGTVMVEPKIAEKKLRALVEGAQLASRRLWP